MKALLCAVALAVFLAPARAAYLDSNRAVSAESQMNGGGCCRVPADRLTPRCAAANDYRATIVTFQAEPALRLLGAS